MAELLIRASRNDHAVIADLLAPGGAGLTSARPVIDRLVVDAVTARDRPQFGELAEQVGLPFVIDPGTPLLQDEQRIDDSWARLPFAQPEQLRVRDFTWQVQERLVAAVVDFQLEHGASLLIPAYVYVDRLDSGWLDVNIQLLARTAEYLDRQDIKIPAAPVLALSLHKLGPRLTWAAGLDRLLAACRPLQPPFIALGTSWNAGLGDDSYDRVQLLFTTAGYVRRAGFNVVAWRQGLYGLALVGDGAAGYETGIGLGERCDYTSLLANRRPAPRSSGGGPIAGVYSDALGRSLDRSVAQILLADRSLRGELVCATGGACCPDGVVSMLAEPRPHAVRTRAHQLHELDRIVSPAWRLNKIARDAERGAVVAELATRVLAKNGVRRSIPSRGLHAAARVADHLQGESGSAVA